MPQQEPEIALSESQQRHRGGIIGWLPSQPGFRTALIAFVLTVVLGIGGTAAYAYWSQSAAVTITATTRSDLPPNTALVTAQPALAARPGTPSNAACKTLLTEEKMRENNYTDTRFSWQAAAKATSYLVTIRTKTDAYEYNKSQTVTTPAAEFQFERLLAAQTGKSAQAAFYTEYAVRVMPMTGATPGDPLYFTYEYGHYSSSNCYEDKTVTGASPVGNIIMSCALPEFKAGAAHTEPKFTWTSSAGATSYAVTMRALNGSGYGGEQVVTGPNAAFRVMQPQPIPSAAPYFGRYTVRVQPMKGAEAGDPRYLIYQLGANSHECWDEGPNYRPPSSS